MIVVHVIILLDEPYNIYFILRRPARRYTYYEIMSAAVCARGKIFVERNVTLQAYNKSLEVRRLS